MPIVKHVDADADRILHAVKSALFDQAPESVRIVKVDRFEVPLPPEQTSFIEVHSDGLVELWEYDGHRHSLRMSCIEPRAPTTSELTAAAAPWLSASSSASSRRPWT